MDSATLEIMVKDVVTSLCDTGKVFSAFEVTKAIRAGGNDVRHYQVKEVVHDLFFSNEMSDDYTRSLRNIDAQKGDTWVYYPYTASDDDVEEYLDTCRGIAQAQPVAAVTAPAVVQTAATADDDDEDYEIIKSVDDKNRLRIPADFMRKIGVAPFDQVCVMTDPVTGKIAVAKTINNMNTRWLAVDNYNNLRIPLTMSGLSAQTYRIKVSGHAIEAVAE